MTIDVCTDTGGLIDPTMIPVIRVGMISDAARTVRNLGTGVRDEMQDVNGQWGRLRNVYLAPEQEVVYGALRPAVAEANDFNRRMSAAGRALETFADALGGLRAEFNALRREAREFRDSVINGVRRPIPNYDPYGYGMVETQYETVPWYDDQGTLTRNRHLIGRVNEVAARLSEAEAECANTINGQLETFCVAPATSYTAEQLHGADSLPWGYAREYEAKNCGESVALGLGDVVVGTVEGLGGLAFGYDPNTGEWFQGNQYAQSWGGLGNLAFSVVMVSFTPLQIASDVMRVTDPGNEFTEFMEERNMVVANTVTSLVNVNLYAEDPFEAWREDGIRALVSGAGNVVSIFAPGANVAAVLKIGGTGGRVARVAGVAADALLPGSTLLAKGVVNVFRFGDDVAEAAGSFGRRVDGAPTIRGVDDFTARNADGRIIPTHPDGTRIQVNGRDVFFSDSGKLFYENGGRGNQVRYADYPPEIAQPGTTTVDVHAQMDSGTSHVPDAGDITDQAGTYGRANEGLADARTMTDAALDQTRFTREHVGSPDFTTELRRETRAATLRGDVTEVQNLRALENAIGVEEKARRNAIVAAEHAGMEAGVNVQRADGFETLVDDGAGTGAYRADLVGVKQTGDGFTLDVVEAKGSAGGSPSLGARTLPDGVRVQQGTAEYLADTLRRDPRVADALAEYAKTHPGFREAWNSGAVDVQYRLVTTAPDGSTVVRNFGLNRDALVLPKLQ